MTDPFPPLPEPDDPRELPPPATPAEPEGRTAVVSRAMAQEITITRLTAAARRPTIWFAEVLYAGVLLGLGFAVGTTWWSPIAWLAAGLFVATWVVSRASRKVLHALYPPDTSVRVSTGTDGLRFGIPTGSYLLPWGELRSAELVRDHLVLRRAGTGGAIILPPPLFGPDTVEAAEAAVRQNTPAG